MKAIITNWRYYVLVALLAIGLFALISEPIEESNWCATFLISKGIAAISFYALYLCVKSWEAHGDIPEFTNQEIEE